MNRTYEEWLKYYENATKEQVIEDMMLDIKELKQLKKQKDDVVEYIKNEDWNTDYDKNILRMLGEINE